MMKSIKNSFLIAISFLFIFTLFSYSPKAMLDVNIKEDSSNTKTLPKNFRKTSDLSSIENINYLNLEGLDTLNISGSEQFTEFNLPLLKENINNDFNIVDIDLREESHGFINGFAISFANSNNSANKGLTYNEVINKENEDLSSIKIGEPLIFYNNNKEIIPKVVQNENNSANKGLTYNEVINKENEDLSSIKIGEPLIFYNNNKEIIPKVVQNEEEVTKAKNLSYFRIPVTDGGLPNEDMVNRFVSFVSELPENTWLHFHCKAGIGRTTTFMIMYDIMKNYDNASLDDIIARQVLLANLNPKESIDFFMERRYTFLNDFYNKCKNDKSINTSSNSIISANNLISTNNSSYIKNSKVQIVTPENFMRLIERNVPHIDA